MRESRMSGSVEGALSNHGFLFRPSVDATAARELAELVVFELDGAHEVVIGKGTLFLRGEKRGAEGAVADVAARERIATCQ